MEDFEAYEITERQRIDKLMPKWKHLTDAYEAMRTKRIMTALFENEERALKRLAFIEADQGTATLPTSVFPAKVIWPLVDQIFPNLVAMQICRVVPMASSVGRIYYRKYKWSNGLAEIAHQGSTAQVGESGTIPLVRMTMTSADISAIKYALRAYYPTELAEDAIRDGAINFEEDMIAALRDEVVGELDYRVLKAMFDNAGNNVNFSTTPHSNESVHTHNLEIFDACVDAHNEIWKDMQVGANFLVGDPISVGRLEKCSQFSLDPAGPSVRSRVGAVRVGNLGGLWDVYKTTQAPANKLLLGSSEDAYAFCPYIPLEVMDPVYHEDTDEMGRSLRTRFSEKLLNANALCTVSIS